MTAVLILSVRALRTAGSRISCETFSTYRVVLETSLALHTAITEIGASTQPRMISTVATGPRHPVRRLEGAAAGAFAARASRAARAWVCASASASASLVLSSLTSLRSCSISCWLSVVSAAPSSRCSNGGSNVSLLPCNHVAGTAGGASPDAGYIPATVRPRPSLGSATLALPSSLHPAALPSAFHPLRVTTATS